MAEEIVESIVNHPWCEWGWRALLWDGGLQGLNTCICDAREMLDYLECAK